MLDSDSKNKTTSSGSECTGKFYKILTGTSNSSDSEERKTKIIKKLPSEVCISCFILWVIFLINRDCG